MGVKPRSPKGRAQRAGLTHASASNTLPCQCETLHSKLLRSIKNPIDSDHGIYGDLSLRDVMMVAPRHGAGGRRMPRMPIQAAEQPERGPRMAI